MFHRQASFIGTNHSKPHGKSREHSSEPLHICWIHGEFSAQPCGSWRKCKGTFASLLLKTLALTQAVLSLSTFTVLAHTTFLSFWRRGEAQRSDQNLLLCRFLLWNPPDPQVVPDCDCSPSPFLLPKNNPCKPTHCTRWTECSWGGEEAKEAKLPSQLHWSWGNSGQISLQNQSEQQQGCSNLHQPKQSPRDHSLWQGVHHIPVLPFTVPIASSCLQLVSTYSLYWGTRRDLGKTSVSWRNPQLPL